MASDTTQGISIRVLIVDDDKDVLDLLEIYLGRFFEVKAAASGKKALEIVRTWLPHTLVSDIRMPDMNGFMLLQEIGKQFPDIRRIALSGNLDPGDARALALIEPYAERALGKPVQPELLVRMIRELSGDPRT